MASPVTAAEYEAELAQIRAEITARGEAGYVESWSEGGSSVTSLSLPELYDREAELIRRINALKNRNMFTLGRLRPR